jgi:predicted class III extradiol MEMO1 family dioxygenase
MSTQPEEFEEGEIVSDEYETEDEISVDDQEIIEDLEDLEDLEDDETDIIGLMTSLMATQDGDTVCSALVEISNQMQVQNKILIKILAKLQD